MGSFMDRYKSINISWSQYNRRKLEAPSTPASSIIFFNSGDLALSSAFLMSPIAPERRLGARPRRICPNFEQPGSQQRLVYGASASAGQPADRPTGLHLRRLYLYPNNFESVISVLTKLCLTFLGKVIVNLFLFLDNDI